MFYLLLQLPHCPIQMLHSRHNDNKLRENLRRLDSLPPTNLDQRHI